MLINRFAINLKQCGLFSDFVYGFRSTEASQLTVDLLTVVFDRISRAFNRFGANQTVTLDISKDFDKEQGIACWSSSRTKIS